MSSLAFVSTMAKVLSLLILAGVSCSIASPVVHVTLGLSDKLAFLTNGVVLAKLYPKCTLDEDGTRYMKLVKLTNRLQLLRAGKNVSESFTWNSTVEEFDQMDLTFNHSSFGNSSICVHQVTLKDDQTVRTFFPLNGDWHSCFATGSWAKFKSPAATIVH